MANAHFVAKFHESFKDYKLLCQLDKAKSLNIGNAYDNDNVWISKWEWY